MSTPILVIRDPDSAIEYFCDGEQVEIIEFDLGARYDVGHLHPVKLPYLQEDLNRAEELLLRNDLPRAVREGLIALADRLVEKIAEQS